MKIMGADGYVEPKLQQWIGIILFFLWTYNGVNMVLYPFLPIISRPFGILLIASAPLWLWVAWRGYRKTGKP